MFGLKKKTKKPVEVPFWKRKALHEMTSAEWESLCDGCGKCCLNKLEHETTGEILYTNAACRLLDLDTCRCTSYEERQRFVPDCRRLTPQNVGTIPWLPMSCAYRRLAEGKDLEWWHPLVSGTTDTVVEAGISVFGRIVSERDVEDLEDYVVDWPK
ncbi:MAG: YcgN family cysteine cluster protein [Rhodospirillales bacterium]|nr:YcgN family cysteine cluster protein [Rhodospirillales bacterium]MBO6788425.1 YcgN family cysteine cluster protein [Rhodospirillales bacterium]